MTVVRNCPSRHWPGRPARRRAPRVEFFAQVDQPTTQDATFNYQLVSRAAEAGIDVVDLGTGSVTIPAGETFATFKVLLVDDDLVEQPEDFAIELIEARLTDGTLLPIDEDFGAVEHVILDNDEDGGDTPDIAFFLADADADTIDRSMEIGEGAMIAGEGSQPFGRCGAGSGRERGLRHVHSEWRSRPHREYRTLRPVRRQPVQRRYLRRWWPRPR